MAVQNDLDLTATGIITHDGSGAFAGSTVTQYGVVVGGASNAVSTVAIGDAGEAMLSNGAGVDPSMQSVTGATLPIISGATYNTLGEYHIATGSSGVITGMDITDAGAGAIDIASGSFFVRTTASDIGDLVSADFAGDTGVTLTDDSANYVYISYNAGTPQTLVTTSPTPTDQDNIIVGVVYRDGTELHISQVNIPTTQIAQKLSRRLGLVDGVTRQSGIVVGETGTRNLTITAGTLWLALTDYSISAFDSSGADSWVYYYSDGVGGFTAVASSTQINNTQYDDGSGTLATLGNSKYGVHWVYRSVDDETIVVYGTDSYTLTDAQNALPPSSLPLQVTNLHVLLVAKVVIQKSASSFTEIQLALTDAFTPGLASDHGDLSGLQGGTTDEYYHLTSAEYGLTGILTGNGASIMSASTVTQYAVLLGGASNAVNSTSVPTNGQLLIGNTGTDPDFANLTGTSNEIDITNGAGSITLTLSDTVDLSAHTSFAVPSSATPTVNANGEIANDTTVTDWSHGILKYYGGEEMGIVAMPIAQFTSPTDDYVVTYNATNDEFELQAGGGGSMPQINVGKEAAAHSVNTTTAFAPVSYRDFGSVEILVRSFDDTGPEYIQSSFQVPEDLGVGASNVTFEIIGSAATAAASKNVKFTFDFIEVADSGLMTGAYGSAEVWDDQAISATQDDQDIISNTETITNLGWTAGNTIYYRLYRSAATTNNLTGDYDVIRFNILIPQA